MRYFGTIKNKEKELGNLRRFLTQNKERYFNQSFSDFQYTMFDLYQLNMLDEDETRYVKYDKVDSKITKYLNDIFTSLDDLSLNINLIIPQEKSILNKLFSNDELWDIFEYTIDLVADQCFNNGYTFDFPKFCAEFLSYLYHNILNDESQKQELIKDFIFRKTLLISTGINNKNILKDFFEEKISTETINIILNDFYNYAKYNNKYRIMADSETKIKLFEISFNLMNPYLIKDTYYVLRNFKMCFNISGIGKIKFDNNGKLGISRYIFTPEK